MKRTIISIFLIFCAGVAGAVALYWNDIKGILPLIEGSRRDISKEIPQDGEQNTNQSSGNGTLSLPEGFSISLYSKDVPGARDMAIDNTNTMWVSLTSSGKIAKLIQENGIVKEVRIMYGGLERPHGIAFDPHDGKMLYIATEGGILKIDTSVANALPQKIIALPTGGNHTNYSLRFGLDDRLYVSIGSTCNVCNEQDTRRAKIYSFKRDGSDFKEYARGLRNAPFFTWSYVDGRMWATEMGRDFLGDDLPPDEINIIEEGKNYGWPTCYGKNIHDTDFDKNTYFRNPCMEPLEKESYIDLPAHSAPLGLVFVPEEGWPEEYWYDLLVAYHGSWNRSTPTGYKIVRIKLDDKGNFQGIEDFITGWNSNDGILGRPVNMLIYPGGTMFISDDKAGVIYKVTRVTS